MRIGGRARLAYFAVLVLNACSERGEGSPDRAGDPAAERIACARPGAPLTRDCTVERSRGEGGVILTIRHPDGAFRRLLVGDDGRGVTAADGAQQASARMVDGGETEITLAGDRYRLHAPVKDPTP
jgi:hypothetical protein